jgi:hypothetical protein
MKPMILTSLLLAGGRRVQVGSETTTRGLSSGPAAPVRRSGEPRYDRGADVSIVAKAPGVSDALEPLTKPPLVFQGFEVARTNGLSLDV